MSNWYDARLISILGLVISPGTLSYPLSFLISDSITEVYGFKKARLAIWTALFFNLLFILFGQLIIQLPSPTFSTDNESFDKLLSLNFWIVCASFISCIVSEPINSFLIAKLKIYLNGRYVGIRFISSTIIATFLDTILFVSIAYHNEVNYLNMIKMVLNVWWIKVFIEIIFLPFSIRITKWLKQQEQTDIYDYQTNFNIFSLDSTYRSENNRYNNNGDEK